MARFGKTVASKVLNDKINGPYAKLLHSNWSTP